MNVSIRILVSVSLLVTCACQEQPAIETPGATQTQDTASTGEADREPAAVTTEIETSGPSDTTYRRVEGKLFSDGREVVVLVPNEIEIESDRLIEVKDGPDESTFYFVSVLP